mgnify:CR=1 FL=1|jgi:hypothetical protein
MIMAKVMDLNDIYMNADKAGENRASYLERTLNEILREIQPVTVYAVVLEIRENFLIIIYESTRT